MSGKGFFSEFSALLKKHFLERKRKMISDQKDTKIASARYDSSDLKDRKKQEKIHRLCQELLNKQEMIASGKLQFIGLKKVRRRLGKSWAGLRPVVYNTVEEVIKGYMGPEDLYLRYGEDNYILIFARASFDEAEVKSALIAEEIRKRMFETEHKELQKIRIEREVRAVRTKELRGSKNITETVESIFYNEAGRPSKGAGNGQSFKEQNQPVPRQDGLSNQGRETIPDEKADVKIIEVEAYKSNLRNHAAEHDMSTDQDFIFTPIWDVKRMALTTYLCMFKAGDAGFYPFRSHKELCRELPHSQRVERDLQVLKRVIAELKEMQNDNRSLFICCPVHYETLIRNSSFQHYEMLCQKIPEDMKKFVFFLIYDFPKAVHRSSLSGFVGPLKTFCRYVCAEVPCTTDIDFETLRVSGVDSVGIDLSSMTAQKQIIEPKINHFVDKAKKNFIPFVFILGVADLRQVTSAVISSFDLVGGAAIHTYVRKPDKVYRFHYEDLYRNIVKARS